MSSHSSKSNNSLSKNVNSSALANDDGMLCAEEIDVNIISSGDELDNLLESLLAEKEIAETKEIVESNTKYSSTKESPINLTKNTPLTVKETDGNSFFKKVRSSFGFKNKEEQEWLAQDKKERAISEKLRLASEKERKEKLENSKRVIYEKLQFEDKKIKQGKLEQEFLLTEETNKKKSELEQLAQVKVEQKYLAKEKAEKERLEQERLTKEKAEKERLVLEGLAKQKAEAEKLERKRLAKKKAEKERLVLEGIAKQKAEAERLERKRLAKKKAEKERLVLEGIVKQKAEAERLERKRLAKKKVEKARLVLERIAKEKAEKVRLEQERLAKEKAKKEKLVQERIAKQKAEAERLEWERLAKKKAEKERLVLEHIAKKKAETERLERDRLAKEKSEKEEFVLKRLAKDRADKEKLEQNLPNNPHERNEVKQSLSKLAKVAEQQVKTIEAKPIQNVLIKRSVQLCGKNDDIKNIDLISEMSFNPDDYILSIFIENLERAKLSHQLIQLKLSGVTIVIDHKLNTIYCDTLIGTEKYYDVCNSPISSAEIISHEMNYEEAEIHKNIRRDKLEFIHSIESFIWTTSLLISHGKLPENTDVLKKIRLKEGLALDSFETIPHAKEIEKFLRNKQCNLIGVSQHLQIPQRYVFAFYNGALNLGMIEIINTKKKRKEKALSKTVTSKVKPSLASLFGWKR